MLSAEEKIAIVNYRRQKSHESLNEAKEVIKLGFWSLAGNRLYYAAFHLSLIHIWKNSLFFGSDRMARVSAVYHTIISTCKMQGVSVLDYFKRFFSEIIKGRRDYEHLLALTIGLN